jgi:hypothetical protein
MGAGPCFRSSRTAGRRRHHQLLTALRGSDLQAAGLLEVVHFVKRVADGAARGQQAIMARDDDVVVAKIAHQPAALVEIERDASVQHVPSTVFVFGATTP